MGWVFRYLCIKTSFCCIICALTARCIKTKLFQLRLQVEIKILSLGDYAALCIRKEVRRPT
jgi:hypothetical protein